MSFCLGQPHDLLLITKCLHEETMAARMVQQTHTFTRENQVSIYIQAARVKLCWLQDNKIHKF